MNRWPFRYHRQPADAKGIEDAKAALAIARQIEAHASRSEIEHRDIQRRNHLAPKFEAALREPPS